MTPIPTAIRNLAFVAVLLHPLNNIAESAGPIGSTAAGVFTVEQSVAGETGYLKHCSTGCHGSTLTGGDRVPALAGDAFVSRWKGLTVGALFQRIRSTMPQTKPGSLSDNAYADIVAFLLDANGYPSGKYRLGPAQGALDAIAISEPGGPD